MGEESGRSVVCSSRHIWGLAEQAAQRAREAEEAGKRRPPDALVALILAATSAEGFINELGPILRVPPDLDGAESLPRECRDLPNVLEDLESAHARTTTKYLMASQVLSGTMFPKGEAPFQDFDTLMQVRNLVVHPDPVYSLNEQHDVKLPSVIKDLVQRGLAGSLPARVHENPLNLLRTADMAFWACEATREIIRATVALVPKMDDFSAVEIHLRGWREQP